MNTTTRKNIGKVLCTSFFFALFGGLTALCITTLIACFSKGIPEDFGNAAFVVPLLAGAVLCLSALMQVVLMIWGDD